MRNELPDVTITIDREPQRSSTTIAGVGAYVVVVATALPARAVTLTSCYVGQLDGNTAASHLLLAPDRAAALEQHVLPGPQPGSTHARTCLLDHAARLQAALADSDETTVQIDVGPDALARAAAAWTAHDAS